MIEFDFAIMIPIVAILATAWMVVTGMKLKHRGGAPDSETSGENSRLRDENVDLHRTVDRLEARLSVLERIATDPAERTAREIEKLR